MKSKYKLVLFPLIFALSSCGYGLKEVYPGDAYATGNFQKDYYRVWNEKIDERSSKNNIIRTESYELNEDADYVFTEYSDSNFRLVDKSSFENLKYEDDYYPNQEDKYLNTGYGPTKKCSRIDDSFRYGYLSKLYDGQMFCHGRYQQARVQIDTEGFGALFAKETTLDTYFAVNFKASYDYTKYNDVDFSPYGTQNVPKTETKVTLKVSFYCKEDKGYIKKTFSYPISNIDTNAGENPSIYTFFGFRTINYDLSRVAGYSIEFDFDRDDLSSNPMRDLKDKNGNPYVLDYSLMLYEVFMPGTTWR